MIKNKKTAKFKYVKIDDKKLLKLVKKMTPAIKELAKT